MYNETIRLKSVYGKVEQTYWLQPCADPRTGQLPSCVKTIDSLGNMILSETDKELMSRGEAFFFPVDHLFEIVDGYTLDLSVKSDIAIWDAIKNSSIIALERTQKDSLGNNVIDGDSKSYGKAELYVERPGEITKAKVSKKTLRFKAETYIHEDSESERIKKCKVLGRDLKDAAPADVLDYLLTIAEANPDKIINLYEGDDWKMQLFLLDAIDRGVVKRREGVYRYDDKLLGTSIESAISLLRDIKYRAVLNSIKQETYPEYATKSEIESMQNEINDTLLGTHLEDNKTTKKK